MDPNGAVGLDESPLDPPSPPLSPLPGPRGPRPLFYAGSPSEEETEEGLLPGTAEDGDAGSSTADPWTDLPSESLDESEAPSWGTSPAGERPPALLSKAALRKTTRTAVKTGTGVAHTLLAKTEAQRAVELYKADDEDAAAIGDPLADIAHRRGDVLNGKLSEEANDVLRMIMGIGQYLAKQIGKVHVVREIEAGHAAGEVQTIPRDVA